MLAIRWSSAAIVRCRLVSRKAAGRYRLDASRPLPKAGSISHADLATALLDSLARPDLYRRNAYVAS